MKNELKIQIPDGFKIESFDQSTGEIKFAPIPKNIKERLKTIADVFEYHGITKAEFETKWEGYESHEIGNALEKLIVSAYNEGKLPDWTDGTYKYFPYFNMGSPSGAGFSFDVDDYWCSGSSVGSRLVFVGPDAKANLYDAVEKFLPEYKQSRTS